MKEKEHFIHVCYETGNGMGLTCKGHTFIRFKQPYDFQTLLDSINKEIEESNPGYAWNKRPTIVNINEISKELWECLFPEEEDKED